MTIEKFIPYIYDAVIVIILLLCIGNGYKRGVLKTVLSIICLVIAYSTASMMSSYSVCEQIYDEYVQESIYKYVDEAVDIAIEKAKDSIKEKTQDITMDYLEENFGADEETQIIAGNALEFGTNALNAALPELYSFLGIDIHTLLTNPMISDKINTMTDEYSRLAADEINKQLPMGITVNKEAIADFLRDSDVLEAIIIDALDLRDEDTMVKTTAEYVESKAVKPVVIRLIGIIIWSAVFSLVNFVLRIIIRVILAVRKIEPIKACDSLLGGALGAAFGILVIAVALLLIMLLTQLTGGMTYMNEEVFSQSFIFGRLYDFVSDIGLIGIGSGL